MPGFEILPGVTPFQFDGQTYRPGDQFRTQDPCRFLAFLSAARAANPNRGTGEEVNGVVDEARRLCPAGTAAVDATPTPDPQPTQPSETPASDLAPEERGDSPGEQGAPDTPPSIGQVEADDSPGDDPPPEEEGQRPPQGEPDSNARERGQERTDGGDPVDLYSGQFRLDELDLAVPDTVMPLAFRRMYLSGPGTMGPLGWNWDHNYNIYVRELTDGRIALWRHLNEHWFVPNGPDFDSPRGMFERLTRGPGAEYRLSSAGGLTLVFARPAGWSEPERIPITRMEDRFGNALAFDYDGENRLAQVTETDTGYFLRLRYDACGLLSSVADHSGRRWLYEHDEVSFHLTCAIAPPTTDHPEGTRRIYHYELYTAHSGLRHGIVRVSDHRDRTYVENVYDPDPSSWSFGRVREQLVGGHLFQFCYTQLQYVAPIDENMNIAGLRVQVRNPDLALETYTFNFRGDLLDRRFRLVKDGSYRIVAWRYAYDTQGNTTETLAPDGSVEVFVFDEGNADPRARANLLRHELRASPAKPAPSRIVSRRAYLPELQLISEEIDEFGTRTRYRYDVNLTPGNPTNAGRLLRVELPDTTLPDGSLQSADIRMTYRANGQLETVTGADGSRMRLDYGAGPNDLNRIIQRTVDEGRIGAVSTFTYDAAGYLETSTTPEGHAHRSTTNAKGQVEERSLPVVNGSAAVSVDHYDGEGALIARETPKGAYADPAVPGPRLIEEIERDLQGHPVRIVSAANTSERRETRVCRDFRGLPLRVEQADGRVEEMVWDERGLLLRRTILGTDGTKLEEQRVYDRTGRLVRSVAVNGMETELEYDGFGRLSRERRSNGAEVETTWDGRNPTGAEITGPDGAGNIRVLSRMTAQYDERGRRIAEVRRAFVDDPAVGQDVRRTIFHDAADRPVGLVDARGNRTEVRFDGLGRMEERRLPDGNRISFVYDDDGNLTEEHEHHLLPDGSLQEIVRSHEYDARGRKTATIHPDGSAMRVVFDDRDLAIRQTDELGTDIERTFNAHGELVARLYDPGGLNIVESWGRDSAGLVSTYTDPDGEVSTYLHDGIGRMRELSYPTGHQTRLTWDAQGLPETERLATGAVFEYEHDAHGRLTRIRNTVSPVPVQSVGTLEFRYDGLDRMVRATAPGSIIERRFDSFSRLVSENNDGTILTAAYDDIAGEVTRTWPDGRREVLAHDATEGVARVTQVANGALGSAGGVLVDVTKSGPSKPGRLDYASGLQTEYHFDDRKRAVEIASGGGGVGSFAGRIRYLYNARNQITGRDVSWLAMTTALWGRDARHRITEARLGFVAAVPRAVTQSDHDAAMAVSATASVAATEIELFTYGASDQRLTAEMPGRPNQNLIYQAGHRPLNDGTDAYTFGAEGTLTSKGALQTRVDAFGRVIEVSQGGVPVSTFAYDALGRPSSVLEAGRPVRNLQYFGAFSEQETEAGAAVRQFTLWPGSGQPIAVHDAGRTLFPHFDARASLVALTDGAGALVETCRYSSFGIPEVRDAAGAVLARSAFGVDPIFGGQRYVPAAGLYLSRRRLYDPALGIFWSMDPNGYVDSPSLYVYAGQDPVDSIDPNGEAVPLIIAALVIAGALGGAGYSFWDAYHHPERYEGWTGGLRAFGNTIGGAVIGGATALVGEAVLALGGVGVFAEGSAVTLTTAQTFTLYGTASATSGAVGRYGFNGLFPEYIDPVSAETIATDYVLGGGLPVVGNAVAPYARQFAQGAKEFSVVAWESAGNGALRAGAREMWNRSVNGNWRAIGNTWRLLRNPNLKNRYTWRELFFNRRPTGSDAASSASIRSQYWSQTPNGLRADGKALHHWFFQNQNRLIPQGIKDSTFNLLEVPGPLNSWMGGHIGREWSFRAGILTILGLDFAASYLGTRAAVDAVTGDDGEPGSASTGSGVGDEARQPNDQVGSK